MPHSKQTHTNASKEDSLPPSALVCLSVSAPDFSGMVRTLAPVRHLVDVVEIRLDAMPEPCPEEWMSRIPLPVLVTNRPTWEGGAFGGSEQERIALLCRAIRAGASYVDLELACDASLRAELLGMAASCQTRVILSYHNFFNTPDSPELEVILRRMLAIPGIHGGKMVTMATTVADMLRLPGLQQIAMEAGFPLSAFAMGPIGKISRLATLYMGGYMTYVSPDKNNATAPGQLTVQELTELKRILTDRP